MVMQELARKAMRATSMSALNDVLRDIALKTNSYGCILWRVGSPHLSGADAPTLFVVANWFEDDRICGNHSLSMERSITGAAIRSGVQQVATDMLEVPDPDNFLRDAEITTFCSTPITFGDDVLGAVN